MTEKAISLQNQAENKWTSLEKYEQQSNPSRLRRFGQKIHRLFIGQTAEARQQEVVEAVEESSIEQLPEIDPDREQLAKEMSEARSRLEKSKKEKFQIQRAQELTERDFNSRLLKVDDLDEQILAGNSEVDKRSIEFEGAEIPVYDLKGVPYALFTTVVDYKNKKDTATRHDTAMKVLEDPSFWTQTFEQAFGENRMADPDSLEEKVKDMSTTICGSYNNSETRSRRKFVKDGKLRYGFDHLASDSLITGGTKDQQSGRMDGLKPSKIKNSSLVWELEQGEYDGEYDEVVIRRYSETGQPKLPDYIVTYDGQISEETKRHAAYFKIPILNIENAYYSEREEKKARRLLDSIFTESDYSIVDTNIASIKNNYPYTKSAGYYHDKNSIGRKSDNKSSLPDREEYFDASQSEFAKRLAFIQETLQKATENIKEMTQNGEKAPDVPPGFDKFDISIRKKEDGVRRPTDCDSVAIDFQLDGSQRKVITNLYDGEHILDPEAAIKYGIIKQEDLDGADSSHYLAMLPLALDYLDAMQKNHEAT